MQILREATEFFEAPPPSLPPSPPQEVGLGYVRLASPRNHPPSPFSSSPENGKRRFNRQYGLRPGRASPPPFFFHQQK